MHLKENEEIEKPKEEKGEINEIEKWIKIFQDLIEIEELKYILQKELRLLIEGKKAKNVSHIKNLYEFLSHHEDVAVISEEWKSVPSYIKGIGFKLKSRRGPDDKIYKKDKELLSKLPRGIVFINEASEIDLVIFGIRKFFGKTSEDDDKSQETSDTLNTSEFTHFIVSHKANGECCHVGLWKSYWVIGSKNRKIIASQEEDIPKYDSLNHYDHAQSMARCFFKHLQKMGSEKVKQLKSFLLLTKLTLNFEFETPEHPHIVFLREEKLIFIGGTAFHFKAKVLHPSFTFSFANYFGFSSVITSSFFVHPKNELEHICHSITRNWDDEGAVLILLNTSMQVIDLVKVKTFWYILLRAVREKVKQIYQPDEAKLQIKQRLLELENVIKIDHQFVQNMIFLGQKMVDWIKEDPKRQRNVRDQYPVMWLKFLDYFKIPSDSSLQFQTISDLELKFENIGNGEEEEENNETEAKILKLPSKHTKESLNKKLQEQNKRNQIKKSKKKK